MASSGVREEWVGSGYREHGIFRGEGGGGGV